MQLYHKLILFKKKNLLMNFLFSKNYKVKKINIKHMENLYNQIKFKKHLNLY